MIVTRNKFPVAKPKKATGRFFLLLMTMLVLTGCDRVDFRNGYAPGDVEKIDNDSTVYHLVDGVLIEERRNDRVCHYLIESTVADYSLTPQGLNIVLEGENAGTYFTAPAPQGYIAAWITEVEGDVPGITRFQIDDAKLADLISNLAEATTVQDIYKLKK